MSTCTFFGHRYGPSSIKPKLREVLIDLIENHAVAIFYVGQKGTFDAIVRSVLKELTSIYPHIRYAVVLERLPPNEMSLIPVIIPTPCFRKASKPTTLASLPRGATSG